MQRLNGEQTRQIIKDLVPSGFTNLRVPQPVTAEAVIRFCAPMADAPIGRSYGMFDDQLNPEGFFIGWVMPDPNTGVLTGIEHLWWVRPGANGLPLLRRFEKDCREDGCKQMIFGYSVHSRPERMEKLYSRLGFKPHSISVMKELD